MTWEEMVNSKENRANQKKLAQMTKDWGKVAAGLEIRRVMPFRGIEIVPDKNGGTDPVFYQGTFSFNPTCAAGIAYYPETNEWACEPFFIDLRHEGVWEFSMEWMQYFLDRIASSAESGMPAEGMYMIYENTEHPPIPEAGI